MFRFLIFLLPLTVCAEFPVSMEAFLDRLVEVHPSFRTEKLRVDVARTERDAAGGGEEWVFRANPSLGFEKPVSNSSFSPSDARSLGVNASIDRPIWKDGSRVGLDYNYAYVDQEVATVPLFGPTGELEEFDTGLPEFHQHGLMLRYTLPFLKGRGGDAARLPLDRREFALRIAEVRSRENQEDLLLRAASRYVDWVLAVAERKIADQRVALATDQLGTITRHFQQSRTTRVDVLRAEANVAAARQRSLQAELATLQLEVELRRMAAWGNRGTLIPVFDLFEVPGLTELPKDEPKIRLLRLFDLDLERLARENRSLADTEKAQLDLDLRGGLSGGDATFGESAKLDQPDFRAGLVYRVPLGNRTATKTREAAELRVRQTQAQRDALLLELKTSLERLGVQQDILTKMLVLNGQQIALATKQAEAELDQYLQAKSALTFVIQAQDGVAAAESLKAQTAARYHKSVLELGAVLDRLLPEPVE